MLVGARCAKECAASASQGSLEDIQTSLPCPCLPITSMEMDPSAGAVTILNVDATQCIDSSLGGSWRPASRLPVCSVDDGAVVKDAQGEAWGTAYAQQFCNCGRLGFQKLSERRTGIHSHCY